MTDRILRNFFRVFALCVSLLPFAWGVCAASYTSESESERPLVLALVGNYGPELEHYYFGETVRLIRRSITPRKLIIERLSPDMYLDAARDRSFDMSIASSGITHRALEFTGGSQLLSVVRREAPDPARGSGTAVIVRADRDDLQSLADLRHKKVATVTQSAFFGWQVPVAELLLSGYDAIDQFDSILETGPSMVR
ncbi:MAG: PhnD/SsuA/transferrin family substrate-binding protein, partial [Duodenibacillus sp.]